MSALPTQFYCNACTATSDTSTSPPVYNAGINPNCAHNWVPVPQESQVNNSFVSKRDMGSYAERFLVHSMDVESAIHGVYPSSKNGMIFFEGQGIYEWSPDVEQIYQNCWNQGVVIQSAELLDIKKLGTQSFMGIQGDAAFEAEMVFKFYHKDGKKVSALTKSDEVAYTSVEINTHSSVPSVPSVSSNLMKPNAKCIVEITTCDLPKTEGDVNGVCTAFKNLFSKVAQLERVLSIEKQHGKLNVDLVLFYHSNYEKMVGKGKESLFKQVMDRFFQFELPYAIDNKKSMHDVFPNVFEMYEKGQVCEIVQKFSKTIILK